jgi:phosphoglycerate dehydrogenase-like enzyme
MTVEKKDLTIVLNHPSAESYAKLIADRFPEIRTVIAPDAAQLEKSIAEGDVLLAFRFPVEMLGKAKKLRWFQCTGAGVDSLFSVRDKIGHITVTKALLQRIRSWVKERW